ncbi:DUF6493 family protein [Mangrovimonas sp. TPBH4]|uniref:DUF6493 family protein n=1 Tax=Mangrovimonas sp. TPBH4 TaxID=1645914 RepID=UPI0006B65E9E|nr:DUF6493 family protein [Mangrovimonas sp. TPBH4]
MLEKELEGIVLQEKDIIPFLKNLTPKDKRELVPFLKKFQEKIFEHYSIEEKTKWGISYSSKPMHSDAKRDLVSKACYVCFNKTDIKKVFFNVSQLSINDDYLNNIIPWYTPKWYGDLINEELHWGLSYEKMMLLKKKELLIPSRALILAKLPDSIIERKQEDGKNRSFYRPEVLYKYKETLEEHIWLLFEEVSLINNYYHYLHLENYKGGRDIWIDTISNLTVENRLDRERVLIATIYTSTKGFNKTLSGWFFDLLIKLNPSIDEILGLQNEFLAALNSPYSKVINTVLKYFKLVANQKKFKSEVFIENASILLNSETKSVVNSTLMILEKIAKTNKSSSISICKKAAEALINVDEKIQLRAAKIIAKYGNPQKQELLDEVCLYTDSLFHSSKEVLNEYIVDSEEIEEENHELEELKIISKENEVPKLDSLDDLIFFVSQSIDNNEVYHIDLLLSCLPKLYLLLNKDNVAKLEPIFKRSLDLSLNFDWNSRIGNLESEAACYINDFAEILMSEYPLELTSFTKAKREKVKKLKKERFYKSHYENNLKEIEHQTIPDYIYQIHHSLFIKSKSLIKRGLNLGLLSSPTHSPCWIAPKILIDRIISYEEINETIDLYDFQIAIGRLPKNEYSQDVIENITSIVDDDIKNVLKYHFNQLNIQKANILRPELWIQSVLSKNIDTDIKYFQEFLANSLQKEMGGYNWDCGPREHFYKDYDYATRRYVQKMMIRKELCLKDFTIQKKEPESIVSSIVGIFNKRKKMIEVSSIYNYILFKKQKYYTPIQPHDDVKFLFLSPNNSSMFLSHVIHKNLRESTFFDETSKKNMVNLLKGLYEIWYRDDFHESTYLFLATGLLCSDKVARELSAEIWIKANNHGIINNKLVGQILGKLENGEYAPLKRFTDLLTASLFNVSKKHNQALAYLLNDMIGNMNNTPIRGVKKLLEIFLELKLSFPEIEISVLSKEKLESWRQSTTLKVLINKIETIEMAVVEP